MEKGWNQRKCSKGGYIQALVCMEMGGIFMNFRGFFLSSTIVISLSSPFPYAPSSSSLSSPFPYATELHHPLRPARYRAPSLTNSNPHHTSSPLFITLQPRTHNKNLPFIHPKSPSTQLHSNSDTPIFTVNSYLIANAKPSPIALEPTIPPPSLFPSQPRPPNTTQPPSPKPSLPSAPTHFAPIHNHPKIKTTNI
ncbi:hypothetical protein V6N12_049912 [Hibiscus sabdariffa]|uniref:Uncharacterized protein n=1 Tax=Hibiscus sabdariffa TaxID=183260 RepID=A0ABR2GAW2_9ROSI